MTATELEQSRRLNEENQRAHEDDMSYPGYMRSVHDGFFDFRRRELENQPTNASSYEAYMKKMHDAFFNGRMGG